MGQKCGSFSTGYCFERAIYEEFYRALGGLRLDLQGDKKVTLLFYVNYSLLKVVSGFDNGAHEEERCFDYQDLGCWNRL